MDFDVGVKEIVEVSAHPDADRLELARIGGYEIVVGKGQHHAGERVVYLPEASVLPPWLIARLGLEGRLAGKAKNRVKAVRLRGEVSQGLVLALEDGKVVDGDGQACAPADIGDMAAYLGVEKYVPEVPVEMAGQMEPCPIALPHYDVEDWKKDPEALADGRDMIALEKLHGTLTLLAWRLRPEVDGPFISSKGAAHKGLSFVRGPETDGVLYRRTAEPHADRLLAAGRQAAEAALGGEPELMAWVGETIGPKVQDLRYGLAEPKLVVFELLGRRSGAHRWEAVPTAEMMAAAQAAGVPSAPVVGTIAVQPPVDREAIRRVQRFAEGPTLMGAEGQIREGVVLRHPSGAVRKAVSEAYLTRRGGTERR